MLSLKGYGGNGTDQILNNVTQTADGGFILCMWSNSDSSTGNIDSFCNLSNDRGIYLKYNSDATIFEWTKCFRNGPYIFTLNNGNFILGGLTNAVPAGNAFKILKVDSNETVLWRKTYGGTAASAVLRAMIATNDGGYIMAGETNYTDTDFTTHYGSWMNADIAIIKVDSNGDKVWSKVYGGTGNDGVSTLVPASNNGFYLIGSTNSNDHDCTGNHGGVDAYLARFDSAGNIICHLDLGGSGDDGYYCSAISDWKGGVIIANGSNSNDGDIHHPKGGYNYWVLNVDSNNNIVWENNFGGGGGELPLSVCKSYDGSIWVSGYSIAKGGEVDTAYGIYDAWIVHGDSIGNFISAKVIGSSGQDEGFLIYPLSNNEVFFGGYFSKGDDCFSGIDSYGEIDAFIGAFLPWNTEIKQINPAKEISVFPNPTHDMLQVTSSYSGVINVYTVLGKKIYSAPINKLPAKLKVSTEHWLPGLYILRFQNNEGVVISEKLTID